MPEVPPERCFASHIALHVWAQTNPGAMIELAGEKVRIAGRLAIIEKVDAGILGRHKIVVDYTHRWIHE